MDVPFSPTSFPIIISDVSLNVFNFTAEYKLDAVHLLLFEISDTSAPIRTLLLGYMSKINRPFVYRLFPHFTFWRRKSIKLNVCTTLDFIIKMVFRKYIYKYGINRCFASWALSKAINMATI